MKMNWQLKVLGSFVAGSLALCALGMAHTTTQNPPDESAVVEELEIEVLETEDPEEVEMVEEFEEADEEGMGAEEDEAEGEDEEPSDDTTREVSEAQLAQEIIHRFSTPVSEEVIALEERLNDKLEEYRSSEKADQPEHLNDIVEIVQEIFNHRMSLQEKRLKSLKSQVEQIESKIKRRRELEGEIVAKRVRDLLGEPDELSWDEENTKRSPLLSAKENWLKSSNRAAMAQADLERAVKKAKESAKDSAKVLLERGTPYYYDQKAKLFKKAESADK